MRAVINGLGGYLPTRLVLNDELAATVDTTDAWIQERTGIRQRYLAGPHETCSYMGARAAEAALADAGCTADDVDAIILATATPDQAFPATALRVQAELGVTRGFGFGAGTGLRGVLRVMVLLQVGCRARQGATPR